MCHCIVVQCHVVPPSLTPETMDVEVEVGTQLMLTANATEFNLDIENITWTRNGIVIENGTNSIWLYNICQENPPLKTLSLVIHDVVSPAQDNGMYVVYVSNPAGSDSSIFNVTVTGEFIVYLSKCHKN